MSNESNNSSYHDGIFLPFLGSDSVLRIMFRCICADAECKQRSSSFKALGDVRGTFITIPDYNPISNYTNATERKKSKLTRYKKHLGLNKTIAEIASNDNRSKQTDISNRTRSTSESLPKRSKRYIAWHHFHPAAIHYSLSIKNKYNINVLLPKEFVVGTIQIDGNSNGYESADLVEHGDARAYLMVPSYNKGKTKDDIAKVARTKQLQETILSVTTGSAVGRRIPMAATRQLLMQQTKEHHKIKQLQLENKSLREAIRL